MVEEGFSLSSAQGWCSLPRPLPGQGLGGQQFGPLASCCLGWEQGLYCNWGGELSSCPGTPQRRSLVSRSGGLPTSGRALWSPLLPQVLLAPQGLLPAGRMGARAAGLVPT